MPFNQYVSWTLCHPSFPPEECRFSLCPNPPASPINVCHAHLRDELSRLIYKMRDAYQRVNGIHAAIQEIVKVSPPDYTKKTYATADELLSDLIDGFVSGHVENLSLPEKLDRLAPPPRRGRPPKRYQRIRIPVNPPKNDRVADD